MPVRQRFRRLEDLLGARIDEVREEHLQRLVADAISESDDLEFKRGYEMTDRGRHEAAKDVAALANNVGGMIVLGIAENRGVASRLMPASDFDDGEIRRLRSIVADRVHPRVTLDVLTVSSANEPGSNYLLVVVPKSTLAPHAVSKPNEDALIYPVRYGSQTLFLGESQLADRYYDRFTLARSRIDVLDGLIVEGCSRLSQRETPWIVVGVVPESSGSMQLDSEASLRLGQWVARQEPMRIGGLPLLPTPAPLARVGVRRVYIYDPPPGQPRNHSIELHSDGSVFFAHYLWQRLPQQTSVSDLVLVDCIAAALHLAARHVSENCGSGGTALVDARLLAKTTLPSLPMSVVHEIMVSGMSIGIERVEQTVELVAVPPSRHTVDLAAIAADRTEWLLATRLVATDIVQAFGMAEVAQIGPSGGLKPQGWGSDWRRYASWAPSVGVAIDTS